mmetsp:Transcript_36344/g.91394  ORF Transcript_36344/g.91394 Transcript_36344/m.91394 type:complete len:234 (-) Transcript_36344:109-810(-)
MPKDITWMYAEARAEGLSLAEFIASRQGSRERPPPLSNRQRLICDIFSKISRDNPEEPSSFMGQRASPSVPDSRERDLVASLAPARRRSYHEAVLASQPRLNLKSALRRVQTKVKQAIARVGGLGHQAGYDRARRMSVGPHQFGPACSDAGTTSSRATSPGLSRVVWVGKGEAIDLCPPSCSEDDMCWVLEEVGLEHGMHDILGSGREEDLLRMSEASLSFVMEQVGVLKLQG